MNRPVKFAFLSVALVAFSFPLIAQNSEVGQREANQQQRIAQGVKNGSLTPGETAHLERRVKTIDAAIVRAKAEACRDFRGSMSGATP